MIDEQAAHEDFEELVGGPAAAFQLLDLYRNTRASAYPNEATRDQNLRRKALARGYTDAQVTAFLVLQ